MAFFDQHARYPRFKSRRSRQSAHYTRSAFRLKDGALYLAKIATPLKFVWSWSEVDVAALSPTMVIVSREPDDRWYVTFTVEAAVPEPLEATGHAVGIDLGVKDLAVTSDGDRVANPRHLEPRLARWPATSGEWPVAGKDQRTDARPRPRSPARTVRCATPGATSCTA